jgi:hypothetical protein
MLTLLLSLHVLGGPTPVPVRAPLHYKITAKTSTDIDLSAVGQATMSVALTSTAFVTVTTSDTVGGKLVHVVVDSSTFDAGELGSQLPAEYTASPKGTIYHIYVVNGVPTSPPVPSPSGVQAGQFVPGIQLLLAGLRPTKLADSWVDSTQTDSTTAAAGTWNTRITTWTAKTGTGGRIEMDGTFSGTTTVGQGMMKMEMQMTGATHVTAMPGMLSEGGTSTGNGHANMNIAGSAIPMKVTTEVTASMTP